MQSDTWLTPPEFIEALGPFDLDPCCPAYMPWTTATRMISLPTDGLAEKWEGRVWCNPPYGREAVKWLEKMADHGNGYSLTFARTEAKWFWNTIWMKASAVLFIKGRVHFYSEGGIRAPVNAGAPSVIAAYGEINAVKLRYCKIDGAYVDRWGTLPDGPTKCRDHKGVFGK